MAKILEGKQPEPTPSSSQGTPPSIVLYLTLVVVAIVLTWLAFTLQENPDWPGLLINLAAGLIGSVVILIVIDRRFRASELDALKKLPARTSERLTWVLFPSKRVSGRYLRRLIVELNRTLSTKVYLEGFHNLEQEVLSGCIVLSAAGGGKTAWTQFSSRVLAQRYIQGDANGRIPIILPLREWMLPMRLHEALYERFASFATCRRRRFNHILRSAGVIVFLDGYDELWEQDLPVVKEAEDIRQRFPNVKFVVTSSSNKPVPSSFGKTVSLPTPTAEELTEIKRRRESRSTS